MSQTERSTSIAAQTMSEIIEIERRIESLVELRDGLKRVLSKVSGEVGFDRVPRPVSPSRPAMIEYLVVQALRESSDGSLKTKELFQTVRTVRSHLKYVTFRSQLHRLKQRGVISQAGRSYGSWRLCELHK